MSYAESQEPIISVRELRVSGAAGELVHGISFDVPRRGALGIVGESGSGKSLTCRSILGILPQGLSVSGGRIAFEGTELTTLGYRDWQPIRGTRISAVFQDPGSYLNPSITVGGQLAEVLRVKSGLGRREAKARAVEVFGSLGLRDPAAVFAQYPFELSGGMLQRVLIAIALAEDPEVLIADEATTALDATVQAEVLDVLADLRVAREFTLILVSHDLAVVSQLCDRIIVLRDGEIVEAGATADVLHAPQHEYTRLLVENHEKYGIGKYLSAELVDVEQGLLRISDLSVSLGHRRRRKQILHDVSATVSRGELVGLIGETGSGKTTIARSVLGLVRPESGSIELEGTDVTALSQSRLRAFRRAGVAQYVFQDPLRSLDPQLTIAASVGEGLRVRGGAPRSVVRDRVAEALELVGVSPELAARRPAQLSGGQRQRVAIARAMVLEPSLLICDEPVSALDAANRIQMLELLAALRDRSGIGLLFISHDLGSVAGITDRVIVLYRGRIVEEGATATVLMAPQHPYTRLLVGSAPTLSGGAADRERRAELRAELALLDTP